MLSAWSYMGRRVCLPSFKVKNEVETGRENFPNGKTFNAERPALNAEVKPHSLKRLALEVKRYEPQHFLNFLPLPHEHGSLRPIGGWVGAAGLDIFPVKSACSSDGDLKVKTVLPS